MAVVDGYGNVRDGRLSAQSMQRVIKRDCARTAARRPPRLDDTVKAWDLASDEQLRTLTGHTDPVVAVAVTPTLPAPTIPL